MAKMTVAIVALALLAVFAMFWVLYVVLLPLLARLRVVTDARAVLPARDRSPFVVVIVPSHNMEAVISRCVESIYACAFPKERLRVVVVADHCTDRTVERASATGAEGLVRDDGPPGKTYTIAWTLDSLTRRGIQPDLYVITDATATVERGFLSAIVRHWKSGDDVIVGHSVVDIAHEKWFARCLGLTLVHRNLQNDARERLGLSALIEGRGMAYSREYVARFGWTLALPTSHDAGTHPTEDWRHGVRIVEHGLRAAFADDARVITPLRDTLSAATRQGVRWERGRVANAASHGLRLLSDGVRQRSRPMMIAALDAIQLPVAVLGVLCVAVAALGSIVATPAWLTMLCVAPLVLMGSYGVVVIAKGRREGIRISTIAWAPVYLLWRFFAFVRALAPGRSTRMPAERSGR